MNAIAKYLNFSFHRMGESEWIYPDSNFIQLYCTLYHAKTRNASTWNWGVGSGKYMNSSRSWWKKRKMTFGVQNPLAGPGGEPRSSIDARSFIPPRELLYLCEWMNAQLPLFPLSFYPLHCYLNPPIPNFHARHVSRKSSHLRAIALSKEF